MRFFKRQMNPIFVEDEDYNWGGKKSSGMKVLLVLTLAVVAAGLLMNYMA